jgi:hypothetical protein
MMREARSGTRLMLAKWLGRAHCTMRNRTRGYDFPRASQGRSEGWKKLLVPDPFSRHQSQVALLFLAP